MFVNSLLNSIYGSLATQQVIYPKTDEQRARLIEHTKEVFIFAGLEPAHTREVVDAMFEREVSCNCRNFCVLYKTY